MSDDLHADATALAEGLAAQVERWSAARSGDAGTARLAARAAFELSQAIANGHVCLRLADLQQTLAADDSATLRQRLLASGVVGTPATPGTMPMILDDEGRLYLHRHFDYELRLARRLVAASDAPPAAITAAAQARLRTLFDDRTDAAEWQQIAAALALRQRLVVISGGPGTGKTSTVVRLLACLIEQQPDARIALAAPTGKAAARLGEALRQHTAGLPAALRERLPAQASTVHRLLGAHPRGFKHHAGHPLAIDVLVVDEASMLDLALATRLLEAVPATARIVLLGDKDQLAAVESGAVFAELSVDPTLSAACIQDLATLCGKAAQAIVPPAASQASPLRDAVLWFTRNYRFSADSGIARAAADIRLGRSTALLQWLREHDDASVQWLDDAGSAAGQATLRHIDEGYAAFFDCVQRDARDVAAISAAFGRFRVLCATRDGPRGVIAMNARLSRQAGAAASPWYIGRPVMVLRNDPLLQLFNGDIGIALPDAQGELQVHFAAADGSHRAVAPVRLPAHETAYAMTVHKAQGSEFDSLLLLLPDARSRVLTRELLYTAVTRARQLVVLASGAPALARAVDTPVQRHAGLLARLRDAQGPRQQAWSR